MLNLFVIEFLKYRRLAIALACCQVLALVVLLGLGIDLARPPGFPMWVLANAGIAGLFGCLQMLTHKRPMHWVWLLQRPVAPGRILCALLLAALALLAIACLLPYALLLAVQDLRGSAGIEGRHYLLLVLAAGMFASSYLLACFAALHPHRLAFLALPLCVAFIPNQPDTRIALAGALLVLYGILLTRLSFKPDPTQVSNRPLVLLATELPLQFGLYWVLALLFTMGSTGLQMLGFVHDPLVSPSPGTPYAIVRAGDREGMLYALEGSEHPDRDFLRQQLTIGEVFPVSVPNVRSFPQRHQRPPLDISLGLEDPESAGVWRFSHGSMLFEGFDEQSGQRVGYLGPRGFVLGEQSPAERFASVPRVSGNRWLITDTTLYQIDWRSRTLYERFVLPGSTTGDTDGERLSAALTQTPRLTALFSDRHLYLFRTLAFNDPEAALLPSGRVPFVMPAYQEVRRYAVLELIDGYLVSSLELPTTQPEADFGMYGERDLLLYRTDESLEAEILSQQRLLPVFGDIEMYKGLVLAPGMRFLSDLVIGLYRKEHLEGMLSFADIPLRIWLGMAITSLLSAGITYHLLRGVSLPPRTRWFWIALNGCTGLVGLLSFTLGHYWKRLSRRETARAPAVLHPVTV